MKLPQNSFAALSLRDLLDARDQYHVHLTRHPNVVSTAIGYYRIRDEDSWPGVSPVVRGEGPRTLANSAVRPYSWPAVLVFVDKWADEDEFGKGRKFDASDIVPKTLYLPDGRSVPVCLIEAPRDPANPPIPADTSYPLNNIGGGFPVLVEVQGVEHVATIGCLVTDGHKTFALTNRHVSGQPGQQLMSKLNGRISPIGVSSELQLTRLAFSEVYDGFPGRGTFVNLDIGLIDIADLNDWTAKVRSIGTIGTMVDLFTAEAPLALIGRHVRGHGAGSQLMLGEIHALFYRYKNRGGSEYVADFLIGERAREADPAGHPPPFATRPGDSGTLWLLESEEPREPPEFRPLALQWGQNRLVTNAAGVEKSMALATCLSTVCERLNIDLVRDWNLDQPDTWGSVGHFAIASRVAGALSNRVPKLAELMTNNAAIVSHDDETILTSAFKNMAADAFVPLADVPDFFWKHGKQGASRPFEGPNHFADMDQPGPGNSADLLTLCGDAANVDPDIWNKFYDGVTDLLDGTPIARQHRGLLPFRVWQIFDAMVAFAAGGKAAEFVCAAGVLTHYLGDACQPLHISYLHDGDPLQATGHTVHHRDGTVSDKRIAHGAGCHSAYEDLMVNANRQAILDALKRTKAVRQNEVVTSGKDAALATIELMRNTISRLPPANIVSAYVAHGTGKQGLAEELWGQFGDATIQCMQDGTHLIAVLWESAWGKGDGETKVRSTRALSEDEAMNICRPQDFLKSCAVDEIETLLKQA